MNHESSDSDSDLDFIAEYQSNRNKTQPQLTNSGNARSSTPKSGPPSSNGGAQNISALKQELWEKVGETEILRSQLLKSNAEHQRILNELLARQSRDKEDYKTEITEMRRSLEKERIQHQFLLAELRLKNSGAVPRAPAPDAETRQPLQTQKQRQSQQHPQQQAAATAAPFALSSGLTPLASSSSYAAGRARTSSHASLGDGFVLKKPKLASPSSSARSPRQAPKDSEVQTSVSISQSDSSRLLTFLINHRTPGLNTTSLQVLFGCQPPNAKVSVGQDISHSISLSEFAEKVIGYIDYYGATLDSDATEVLLSILYDSMFMELPKPAHQTTLSNRLCQTLLNWAKSYEPFPSFHELRQLELVSVRMARCLTCLLYGLDVLLASNWEMELPFELCRRVLKVTSAPQLATRMIDLMTIYPQAQFDSLITLHIPTLPLKPTAELCFSGMADKHFLSGGTISQRNKYNCKVCMLEIDPGQLDKLERESERRAASVFDYVRIGSVRLIGALSRASSASPSLDLFVLALLTGAVESYAIQGHNEVVEQCMLYFWCRDYASLRLNLESSGLAELCVCLLKLVYGKTNCRDVVEQARQLLQVFTSSEEIDALFEVFEPPVPYYEEDEVDTGDAMMT